MVVVRWEIDVISEPDETGFIDPIKCVREARKIQLDPTSIATVFDVIDEKGRKFRVDLDEIDSAKYCMRCGDDSDKLTKWEYFGKICPGCETELENIPREDYKLEIYYRMEDLRINSDADLDTIEREIKEASEMIKYWSEEQGRLTKWLDRAKALSRNKRQENEKNE